MGNVFRCYVEKKPPFAVEAGHLLGELKGALGLSNLTGVRVIRRYDVEGVDGAVYAAARGTILSEPHMKMAPSRKPAVATNQAGAPGDSSARSMAGSSKLHTEAAVLTPAATPSTPCRPCRAPSAGRKNTAAAPRVVIKKVNSVPSAAH